MPSDLKKLVFNKDEEESLTDFELWLWLDWLNRQSKQCFKLDINDPQFFDLIRVYIDAEENKMIISEQLLSELNMESSRMTEAPPAPQLTSNRNLWFSITAAALLLIIAGISINRWKKSDATGPASGYALLFPDNTELDLQKLEVGYSIVQDGSRITKKNDSLIAYTDLQQRPAYPPSQRYHTMRTPVKGRFYVMLPDKSMVRLNAESSITFPPVLSGNERSVELTGEGYFNVTRNSLKSFRVISGADVEVSVYGTEFNVKAYPEDSTLMATLVKGEIQVRRKKDSVTIQPNQQVIATKDTMYTTHIRPNYVSGLKYGIVINLNGETLQTILKQFERLYGVETEIIGHPNAGIPPGWIDRNDSLPKVIEGMNTAFTNVRFRLDDNDKKLIAESK